MATQDNIPPTSLVEDALRQVSGLVRSEVDLAKAEITQNLTRAVKGIVLIVVATVLAITALHVLAGALVAAFVQLGLTPGLAALAVAALFGGVAAVMIMMGVNALKLSSIAPTRTAKNLKRDANAVKEVYDA
ncbi:phage holin family protein [Aestuariibius insulae]|uniref:phage holin family protein n=1 Tax=Aestuariibius insulae TaxID=2058287 RepID=UPI00345E17BF